MLSKLVIVLKFVCHSTKLKAPLHGVRLGNVGPRRRGTPSAPDSSSLLSSEERVAESKLFSADAISSKMAGVGVRMERRSRSKLRTLIGTGYSISSLTALNRMGGRSNSRSSTRGTVLSAS